MSLSRSTTRISSAVTQSLWSPAPSGAAYNDPEAATYAAQIVSRYRNDSGDITIGTEPDVSDWADKVSTNDITRGIASDRPHRITSGGPSDRLYVEITDGLGLEDGSATGISSGDYVKVLMVVRFNILRDSWLFRIRTGAGSLLQANAGFQTGGPHDITFVQNGSTGTLSSGAITDGSWLAACFVWNTSDGSCSYWENGTQIYNDTSLSGGGAVAGLSAITIGEISANSPDIDVAEFIVLGSTSAFTSSHVAEFQAYAEGYHGVSA